MHRAELLVEQQDGVPGGGERERGRHRGGQAGRGAAPDARARPLERGGDQRRHGAGRPASPVLVFVHDHAAEGGGDRGGGRGDQVVMAVPGQGDRGDRPGRTCGAPDVCHHSPDRRDCRRVVRVVHDDRGPAEPVHGTAAGVVLGGQERREPAADVFDRDPERAARGGAGERVGEHMRCDPAERARDLVRGEQHGLVRAADLNEPGVPQFVAEAAVGQVPPRDLVRGVEREVPQDRAAFAHRGARGQTHSPRIVGVEHQMAAFADPFGDERLHLGQVVKRVDAVAAEVVGLAVSSTAASVAWLARIISADSGPEASASWASCPS